VAFQLLAWTGEGDRCEAAVEWLSLFIKILLYTTSNLSTTVNGGPLLLNQERN
jgi:hypothetical protein